MSNFDKVKEFMKYFGQKVSAEPNVNLLNDEKLKNLRIKLIEEELDELKEAIHNNDYIEVLDAIVDILYVTYGAGAAYGFDINKAFDLVHESNLSKMCFSEDEAEKTLYKYKSDESLSKTYPSPVIKQLDETHWIVIESSTGKALKSINYHPVDLSSLI